MLDFGIITCPLMNLFWADAGKMLKAIKANNVINKFLERAMSISCLI